MSDSNDGSDSREPVIHALLVCRDVGANPAGELTLTDVVEVVVAKTLPGEIGPLVFVALVRGLPPGPGEAAFLIRAESTSEGCAEQVPSEQNAAAIRLPLNVNIPEGYGERQVALQLRVAKIPVHRGGWFELGFHWAGKPLAWNRFAVGQLAPAPNAADDEDRS